MNLDDLEHLKEPEPDPDPVLLWKELRAEDPLLVEESVWQNVDFALESSEDEFEDTLSTASDPTTVESHAEELNNEREYHTVVEADEQQILSDVRKAQFWREAPSVDGVRLETVKKPITDLQAAREILFMLRGLPTSFFEVSTKSHNVQPASGYTIKSASYETTCALLHELAKFGTTLNSLRSWIDEPQSIPLIQAFQSQVRVSISDFHRDMSNYEQRFLMQNMEIIVSLMDLQTYISKIARPLIRIAEIMKRLHEERYAFAFRYLELIYDEICVSQLEGDDEMYGYMGRMFFTCFQSYLTPLRTWMEEGDLDDKDKVFFVTRSSTHTDAAAMWQSRYQIRRSQDGRLHTPKFLLPAAAKIFTTGKSIVILKNLKRFHSVRAKEAEPLLTFESVCTPSFAFTLAPFQDLFHAAFEGWVQNKYGHTSERLHQILFSQCGLQNALDATAKIYFMGAGAAIVDFTGHVFDKLDVLDASWKDRFTLTDIIQNSFRGVATVRSDQIRVHVAQLPRKVQEVANTRRTVKTMAVLNIVYRLPWSVRIIIKDDTLPSYQQIFTFLCQIRRSIHVLTRSRLVKDDLTHTSNSDERALYYGLRSRLLWFTQTMYYYFTSIVLDVRTSKLKQDMENAKDVDDMILIHSHFIKLATDQCLLGRRLELIRKTVIKALDISIKLEDAQAVNTLANKQATEQQQEMMDRSMGSLGLHTPRKTRTAGFDKSMKASRKHAHDSDSDDGAEHAGDMDLSILSANDLTGLSFLQRLKQMKSEFDRHVRFISSGLRGVARAAGGEEGKSWDLLGEMLETGIGGSNDL